MVLMYRPCVLTEYWWEIGTPAGGANYTYEYDSGTGAIAMGELKSVVFQGNEGQVNYTTPLISDFEHWSGSSWYIQQIPSGYDTGEEWETAFRSVLCDC